ncbi:FRG domain-containing protein [Tabrizicola oligotrophica]|uniref:FRG domain-containing protein n=1 Tax=Tabrizicola oligotrophica TaxID=2710650 RepID=A0A6M0QYR6_9RHOB|nr:FRG domain-containing protein [Tabrizicola oligotrophica]NEY92013.1 FRG domain-containing protein [Tabrizicola oligotrophica]
MDVNNFWSSYEVVVESYKDLHDSVLVLSEAASKARRTLVWRGQQNSNWALYSKLYRNYVVGASTITENAFSQSEKKILTDLRRWGLHSQRGIGRLSVLSQLAMLQHFGSPTRLIDITFNALVGAFFATEQNGTQDSADARLFAIDVTGRLINENKFLRSWEDSLDTPWSDSFIERQLVAVKRSHADRFSEMNIDDFKRDWLHEWSSNFYAWRPPALDARIASQNGGFIFGGVVGSSLREGILDPNQNLRRGGFQLVDPVDKLKRIAIDDTRSLTCLAVQPKPFPVSSIRDNAKDSVYSIRIASKAKREIREKLRQVFGYTHATIYPDFPGFSLFGEGKS